MRFLTLATLFGVLIALGACNAVDSIGNSGEEGCYRTSDGVQRVSKIMDSLGNAYQPVLMDISPSNPFGKYCGIDRNAVPFYDESHFPNRWFTIPEDGITDLSPKSLTGQVKVLPTRIFVGTGTGSNQGWDDFPMWPLACCRWWKNEPT